MPMGVTVLEWPQTRGTMFPKLLRYEVLALLAVKAVILTAIYFSFVAPLRKPEPNGAAVLAHLTQRGDWHGHR